MKKISFSYGLMLFVLICVSLSNCNLNKQLVSQEELYFYVGTNSGNPEEGIYIYKMDMNTGITKSVSKYPNLLNPGYLAITNDGDKLYAIHNIADQKESAVSAFKINDSDGTLIYLNTQSTMGRGGCHVSTDTQGDVVAANYSSGSVVLLPTKENGLLETSSSTRQHTGSSINKERQEGPHAHFIQEGSGGLYYAVDLGTDKIMLYQKNNDDQLIDNTPSYIDMKAGSGPRHLDFHKNGKFIYALNELEGSVTVIIYNKEKGSFESTQTISSLPPDFKAFNKSADIHVHPSGKFLYASNRGDHNSIAAYSINQKDGRLTLVEIEEEAIAWPRNFTISPNGKYLLCANRDSDSVTFYSIDLNTGELTYNGRQVKAPKPICVKFKTK